MGGGINGQQEAQRNWGIKDSKDFSKLGQQQ
jgi:hypothetical protein